MGASVRTACVVIALLALACGLPLSGQSPNPVPLINNPLVPTSVAPGGAGFTLTVNGTGFVSGSVVSWNGSPRTTHFVSSSQLTATIPASDIATAGTASINVLNPTPGGGLSNVAYFEVTSTASTLTFATVTSGLIFPMPAPVPPPPPSNLPPAPLPFFTTSIPVAVGDFNGDGKPDLAVYNGAVAILLSNGDGTFQAPIMFTPPGPVGGLVAGDFNGDGKLDLAVTTDTNTGYGTTGVIILLGNGDGTFQLSQSILLPTTSDPSGLVAADFNRDGKLDLAVATYGASDAAGVSVLLGNGDGTFQTPPTQYSYVNVGAKPLGLTAGDFNGDGKLDLAETLTPISSLIIYLGNGDGTFQSPTLVSASFAGDIAAADVNRDGKLDLISSCGVHLGNGDGTFQSGGLPGGQYATTAIGDFNGDGKLDLACIEMPVPPSTAVNVSILLGNGDGTFQSPLSVPVNAPIFGAPVALAIAVADFNGDGKQDLALPGLSADVTTLLQGLIPALTASPNILQFSSQTGGPETITLSNTGTAMVSLSVSTIAISGTNAADFSQTNNCASTLPVGGTCQINVTFAPAPSDSGTLTATLSIPSNAPGSPQTIALMGSVQVLTASPNSLSFPNAIRGTVTIQPVTITNSSTAAVSLSGVTFSGPNASGFSALSQCSTMLGPGASCLFNVWWTPAASDSGNITAALSITSTPGGTLTVPITGSVSLSSLIPGATEFFFPAQAAGTSSYTMNTLTNAGSVAATLSSIVIQGPSAAVYSQTNTCGTTLAAGASCQITLTFTPVQSNSPQLATMLINGNFTGSPISISITGSSFPSVPLIVAPSSITFPGQYVGTSGLPQTLTVTSDTPVVTTISSVTASPADFAVLSNCTNPLMQNSSCTIGVFFDPTVSGTRTGTLTITDNAGAPQTVTLTGTGRDFSMAPGAASSATITPGQTASYTIAVAPAGGFAASVALSCSGGPAGSACAVSPSTMALSGAAAQTAMVTVTTPANGWLLPFRGGWPRDARYRQTPMILTLTAMFLLMVVASQFLRREQNLAWIRVVGFAALVTLGLTLTSCGGGSGSGGGGTNPQAGTYTVTVTGNFTSGATTLNHSAKLTLVVQ